MSKELDDSPDLPPQIAAGVRNVIALYRPSIGTLRQLLALVSSAPDIGILCAHDSLTNLQALVRQTDLDPASQCVVFFQASLEELVRKFPLRWQTIIIEGPSENIKLSSLRDFLALLSCDGVLGWRHLDGRAKEMLAAIDQSGTAAVIARETDVELVQSASRDAPLAASKRPHEWSLLRSLLIEKIFETDRAEIGETRDDGALTLGQVFRAMWQKLLIEDDRKTSGYGRWPYQGQAGDVAIPPTLPDGRPWPRISIVTPTFNQGCFIEDTILSVLRQNYPNLEYIVIDGGSTDETLAVIDRYRDHIDYVVSERDEGQSHAINKGMSVATGEILSWLNSDDQFAPGALFAMAVAFYTAGADMVAGIAEIYQDGCLISEHVTACSDGPLPADDILDLERGWNAGQFFYQPEVFFTRKIWERAGGRVDQSLYYSMDYELWLRFALAGAVIHVIGKPIVHFRQHPNQKTSVASRFMAELEVVRASYLEKLDRQPIQSARAKPNFERKLRVAFLNDHGWHWGAGIAQERLAVALRRAGCEVTALAFADGQMLLQSETPMRNAAKLASHVAKADPDIVLLGNVHGSRVDPFLFSEVFSKWPTLIVMHDFWWVTGRCAYMTACDKYLSGCDDSCPTPDQYPQLAPAQIGAAWKKKRLLLGSEHSPILLGQSSWTAETARSTFAAKDGSPRIEQISLGFPLDTFRPRDRRSCREALGLPQDRFIVLFSASSINDPRKGGDQVIRLARELQSTGILFVATGHNKAEDLGISSDVFRPLGYIDDQEQIARIYAAVDVFVGPSLEETFGQVFAEAIACGTPAVGHGLTGVSDALVDGLTGLVTLTKDVDGLEAALLELYRDPERRAALAFWGRIYAENEWSLEACAQRFYAALRRLGIVDSIGLTHKVGFVRRPTSRVGIDNLLPPRGNRSWLAEGGQGWVPSVRVSGPEGALPEHGLPTDFYYCSGPHAEMELIVDNPGDYLVLMSCQNRTRNKQNIRISVDGQALLRKTLPARDDKFHLIDIRISLPETRGRLELAFDNWNKPQGEDHRAIAIALQSLFIVPLH